MKNKYDFVKHIDCLLEKYVGGVPFFDKLDESIRNEEFYRNVLIPFAHTYFPKLFETHHIIVSGGFGRWRVNSSCFATSVCSNFLIVNGGMRDGLAPIDNLDYLADRIKNKRFVFLDDSFYSGTTRDFIKNEIERLGGFFDGTIVAYDGAPVKQDGVFGVYRYYDYHNEKGEKYERVLE